LVQRLMSKVHDAVFNTFKAPDPHSFGVMKMIQDVYPAFRKKVLEGNPLMQRIVMSGYNPMAIMDYPICGHCETLSAYSGQKLVNGQVIPVCTCFKCGFSTTAPVTFRAWMADELRHKAPADFMDSVDYVVDTIAERMMNQSIAYMRSLVVGQQQQKIYDSNGTPIQSDNEVKIWHGRGISTDADEVAVD